MRTTDGVRMFGYSVSLALFLALAAPEAPRGIDGGIAYAQDSGQPGSGQTPAAGSGQQPGILVPVSAGFVPGLGGTEEGFGAIIVDEGGDISEGLSNQRIDPDD